MTPTTKNAEISSAMRRGLQALMCSAGHTNGQTGGIGPGWLIGPRVTVEALERRGLIEHRFGTGTRHGLYQITAEGCEAIGRSMDEIVAWAWDEAKSEYYERAMRGDYCANRMTVMPSFDELCSAVKKTTAKLAAELEQATRMRERIERAAGAPTSPPTFRELLDAAIVAAVKAERMTALNQYLGRAGVKADAKAKLAELHRRLDAFEADDPFWTAEECGVADSLRQILNGRHRGQVR